MNLLDVLWSGEANTNTTAKNQKWVSGDSCVNSDAFVYLTSSSSCSLCWLLECTIRTARPLLLRIRHICNRVEQTAYKLRSVEKSNRCLKKKVKKKRREFYWSIITSFSLLSWKKKTHDGRRFCVCEWWAFENATVLDSLARQLHFLYLSPLPHFYAMRMQPRLYPHRRTDEDLSCGNCCIVQRKSTANRPTHGPDGDESVTK